MINASSSRSTLVSRAHLRGASSPILEHGFTTKFRAAYRRNGVLRGCALRVSPDMVLTPPSSAIGFKEWSYVCDSLTQGVQTLVLRKGGIHEGRGGFEWKHSGFFLFPTWFHTQGEKLRWVPENAQRSFPPEEERTSVDIDGYATLEQVWKVTDWTKMEALASEHIWNEDVVRERFVYDDESCLHIALVRAYKLPQRWTFPYSKSYGGCRSWVTLPEEGLSLLAAATPALSDAAWQESAARLHAILDPA